MLLASMVIIVGLILLVWSADRFIEGASGIAKNFQIPPMVIGLTIVSLCTSLPEMLVAAIAATEGNNNLGIGNAIGSNIANIGLVLGLTALIAPIAVQSKLLKREFPVLVAIMLLALFLMLDGSLGYIDGIVLLVSFFLFVWWLYGVGMKERDAVLEAEFKEAIPEGMRLSVALMWLFVGISVLLLSSRMVVWGAVEVATFLGVSDLVIGLTIVAVGTSLPELVASIASVLKNESELAIGNVLGSNMFNILAVLTMPALISPGDFDTSILWRDIPIMFGFALALFVIVYGYKRVGKINRIAGGVLLTSFSAYLYLLYLQN